MEETKLLKMKRNVYPWFQCVVILQWMTMSACKGRVILPPNVTIPGIFAYGDSIVDTGNNNGLQTLVRCDFPPYGMDLDGGVPTGRFSNGKTPADVIAKELGIKDLVPAYFDPNLKAEDLPTGVCFASGGTGYDPETPLITSAIPLSEQLEQLKDYIGKLKGIVGEERANFILANSMHLVVAGSNDLANTYYIIGHRRIQYDLSSYADLMVSSASRFVQDIYEFGARRIGVFSLPPIGCLPSQRTLAGGPLRACVEDRNEAAQLVNSKLSSALDSLSKTLPQSRVVLIDVYSPLYDLIQYPQKYGFDVSDRGCCGTGNLEVSILCNRYSGTCPDDSKYVFWDSYHPTEKAYKVLIDQVITKYIDSFL